MKPAFLILLLSLTLLSCDQEPYPVNGELVETGTPPVTPKPDPREVNAHTIVVDDNIDFTEGRLRVYRVKVSVDEPGIPVLLVEDLPDGATLTKIDDNTYEIKWRPSFNAADDPNNPTIKVREYPIVFELNSTIDSDVDKLRKEVFLRVTDNPRGIKMERQGSNRVDEGKKLSNDLDISDLDFPQGPFKVTMDDAPVNAELKKITETKYRVEYSPLHDVVTLNTFRNGSRTFDTKVTITNPRGGTKLFDIPITVRDQRLDPNLVPPKNIVQGLDVSLQVVSYDFNKEVAPRIRLKEFNRPGFGNFSTNLIESPDSFSSVLSVSWTDIPPVYNGQTLTLDFETCTLSTATRYETCVSDSSTIEIKLKSRKPPIINRSSWKVAELVYLSFGQSLNRRVTVVDAEDSALKPKVEIFPESMRKYVSWEGNQLTFNGKKAGTFQFLLKATSDYEVASAESFIIEVFPKNRKKTLFFADSTRDPEAKFYREQFNAQMMNPAIQEVSKRNISGRERLIVGTSTLFDTSTQKTVMNAIKEIPNIIVASPLINQLPEKFLKDLRENYDLDVIGRYSEITNRPLSDMFFKASSVFKEPKQPIRLKGVASSESADPILFNGGLFDREKVCKGVLGLTPDGNNPLVLGVVCDRKGRRHVGARIALLGTEWADLLTSEEDTKIPEKWFNTMIKGTF